MIWYKFHVGDYVNKTSHISDAEDLTYRRMLDLYYISEKPLSLNIETVAIQVQMDVDTVESVIDEFFVRADDGYHNYNCDNAIAKYTAQVANNVELGLKARGKPKPHKNPKLAAVLRAPRLKIKLKVKAKG